MSLNAIFSNGLSGLQASQTALRVVSQNIANVNTPGYARAEVQLESRSLGTNAGGVELTDIRRSVDQFLAAASLTSTSAEGAAGVRADILNRAQAFLGDPNGEGTLFTSISAMFANFSDLSSPNDQLRRMSAVESVRTFLALASSSASSIESLRLETEARLSEQAATASSLLSQIADFNVQIRTTRASGGDATSAENQQSQLIDKLASYIDIRVAAHVGGGVDIRTGAGALLVGDSAVQISYEPTTSPFSSGGRLYLVDTNGSQHPLEELVRGGSIQGLIQTRDVDLVAVSDAIASLVSTAAANINAVHNNSTAIPAPTSMTGRNTGLVSSDALGFTGGATLAITSGPGALVRRIAIDFTAGTYSIDGGPANSYGGPTATIAQFVTGINTALGGTATVSFANGVMSIASPGSNGIVFQQDATTPSSRRGNGFAQFFGLNDLIQRNQPYFFQTGMTAADAHQLTPGGQFSFRLRDATGRVVLERTVAVTGTTWADQLAALNAAGSGIGGFGAFTMDGGGRIIASPSSGLRFEVTSDTTTRGDTSLSMSALFGLDYYSRSGRAIDMYLNPTVAANPSRLALAQPDLSSAIGSTVLESGDNRGASALAAITTRSLGFTGFGGFSGTIGAYAAYVGGELGRRAAEAETQREGAASVALAATERRSSVEGVNLDDELVKMTTYQQSYAAASRVIQAAKDMFDILLSIK